MSYLDHIKRCHSFSAEGFLPFYVAEEQVGWINETFIEHLLRWDSVFLLDKNTVFLNPDLKTAKQRTNACESIMRTLHEERIIESWVGELYAVTNAYGEEPRFLIERAAVSYFGLRGYGVHVNGLVEKPDGTYVWVARRTRDKPFFPGKLDQIVAGGQPAGIGRMQNVIKEAAEEADIPEPMASRAELVSEMHYRGQTHRGAHVDTLFNYDLWLPEDFVPRNTDGEVEDFTLMTLEEMAHITDTSDDFKDNCNLVNIDLLIRQGLITESHPDFDAICTLLYAPATLK